MNKKLTLGITLVSIPLLALLGVIYYELGLSGILMLFAVVASVGILFYGITLLEQWKEERDRTKQYAEATKRVMKKYEKTLRELKD